MSRFREMLRFPTTAVVVTHARHVLTLHFLRHCNVASLPCVCFQLANLEGVGRIWERRCLHANASSLQMSQPQVNDANRPADASDSDQQLPASTQHQQAAQASHPEPQQQQEKPPSPFQRFGASQQQQQQQQPPLSQYQDAPSSQFQAAPTASPPRPPIFQRPSSALPSPPQYQSVSKAPGAAPSDPSVPSNSNALSVVPGMALPSFRAQGAWVPSADYKARRKEVYNNMVKLIGDSKCTEALQIYHDWSQEINPETGEKNEPWIVIWNAALLAQRLLGASINELLKQVDTLKDLGLVPNRNTFTVMFHAISASRDCQALEQLFSRLMESGVQVEAEWCNVAISIYAAERSVGQAMKYVQLMAANGLYPNEFVLSVLVTACVRSGHTNTGLAIVTWCKEKNIFPSFPSLGDLVQGCVQSDNSEGALLGLEVAFDKQRERANPIVDEGTVLAVLGVAARNGDLALAMKAWDILCRSLQNIRPPSTSSFIARLHAFVAAGDLNMALLALRDMEITYSAEKDKDLFSPFSSLRSFVLGCSRGGFAALDAAYFKMEEMAATQKLPLSAINCLILGCSNIWDVDRAYQTFEAIGSVFGLLPNVHSCNALIDGFGKMRKDALKVYDYMVDSGMQPDYRSYCLLINAHVVNRDIRSAMEVLDYMVESGYTIDKETLFKIRRRCIREFDHEQAHRILNMTRKFAYSVGLLGEDRKNILFQLF